MNNNEALNNNQSVKKKSALPWIILVAVVIIAMVVEGFILFNKGRAEKDNDDYTPKTADQFADEYLEFNPDASREDALELFNRDLGEDTFDMLFQDGDAIDPDRIIEYCENGDIIYIDDDGNEQRVTPRDAGKTDEDFDKELEELLKGIEDGTYGGGTDANDNSGSNNSNTSSEVVGPTESDDGSFIGSDGDIYDPYEGDDSGEPWYPEDHKDVDWEVIDSGNFTSPDPNGDYGYGISG